MKNNYEIRGDITAIFFNSRKYGILETLINTSKLEKVKNASRWYVSWDKRCQSYYVLGKVPLVNGNMKMFPLHRWIIDAPKGTQVDHLNHNGLDNTDENIRVLSYSGNSQNKNSANKNSKSGIRGVSWAKNTQKWRVSIKLDYKFMHIGYFSNLEEAEKAAIEARAKHMPYSQEALAN